MGFFRNIAVLCFLSFCCNCYAGPVSKDEYLQIKEVSLDILNRFPPDKFHYIALGRSPTPVMRFLQEMGISSSTIPISNLRVFPYVGELQKEKKLESHFKKFMPSSKQLDNKSILVIDYTDSGDAINIGRSEIEKIIRAESLKSKVLGYVLNESLPPKLKNNTNFFPGAVKRKSLLDKHLFANHYDESAKFGRADIFSRDFTAENLNSRSEYDDLGSELRKHLNADKLLNLSGARSLSCEKIFEILSNPSFQR